MHEREKEHNGNCKHEWWYSDLMKAIGMITTIHSAGFGAYLGRNIREMDGDILGPVSI